MIRVKVCGLTTREDAEHALRCGADALGFVFDPASPRCVASSEVPRALGPYTLCVAVFGAHLPIETGCALHQCTEGVPHDRPFVRALRLRPEDTVDSVLARLDLERQEPSALLLDAYSDTVQGGTGRVVDWGLAAELVRAIGPPVVLAGGLHDGNVAEAVRKVRPYAVDASSGLEAHPGIKDPEKVRRFVEAAKEA